MPPTHHLTVERVQIGDLRTYHRNPRQGDTQLIARSLRVNGQYRALVVNRGTHTGRPNEVLAGNHTLLAMRDEEWDTADVSFIDVDDDQAARIVAIDNRASDKATYDDRLLLELLSELPDLDGTGYDPGDIDDLEALLQESPPPFPPGDDPDGGDGTGGGFDLANTRSLVLAYPGDRYVWVVDQLAKLIHDGMGDSNADVLVALLQNATGDTAPPDAGHEPE